MLLLGAFAYALHDETYEYWIKQRLWIYYVMAVMNSAVLFFGFGAGLYYYMYGMGYFSFLGANLVFFATSTCLPLFLVICTSMNFIGIKFYGKPLTVG